MVKQRATLGNQGCSLSATDWFVRYELVAKRRQKLARALFKHVIGHFDHLFFGQDELLGGFKINMVALLVVATDFSHTTSTRIFRCQDQLMVLLDTIDWMINEIETVQIVGNFTFK
ncbi:hypothetical protein RI540_07930 [Lactiplantibacillus pentosus]|nr:hypothetical protein [Lactiplantibacillus pentosus]MDT7000482.1 hypothetical protein [Lactiplantibacillus pentosus]